MNAPVRLRYVATPVQDTAESGRLILRDGSTAHVRPAEPDDRAELTRFFAALAAEAPSQRFRSIAVPGPELIARLATQGDPGTALTLVVLRVSAGDARIVAVGSYFARTAHAAEVSLAVAAAFRGKGVGTLLLERLALVAVRNGFGRFRALTAAENTPMLELLRASGFEVHERPDGGDIEISLNVTASEGSVARLDTRDRVATVASLLPLFRPNAVAVVGASRDPAAIGARVLDAIVSGGFRGPVYPVNPNATEIAGLTAYRSVREIPAPVDLAVLAVPAAAVPRVVDDCAARGCGR
ncbi:GNAT family N-acetyltransferase [Frigoriglobus tundricola]|uniref:GNAT family N-acetyltransferase n=1 Tax=Frigoriglobus tundricola TaxID=2774151 RepID=UPI00148EA19D|nr:GNAT family N-acetyltransferase [Frigoriglobus tundricola]